MAILAIGILMSMSGAGLAISGVAGDNDASVAQYAAPQTENEGGGNNLAGAEQGGGGGSEEPDQVAATDDSGGSLPFTGLLAIPLLLGGVALTTTGFVLRRQASENDSA